MGYNYFKDPGAGQPSTKQVGCALNNATGTPAFSYQLDSNPFPFLGANTVIAWQEINNMGGTLRMMPNIQNDYTNETRYETVLYSGYSASSQTVSGTGPSAGQIIEVYPDVAFNSFSTFNGYLASCAADLDHALAYLQTLSSPPGKCAY